MYTLKLKYFYFSVLFLLIAIGGYFFGKGLHHESNEQVASPSLAQPALDAVPKQPEQLSVQFENEIVGGPFPVDVIPEDALVSTSPAVVSQ